MMVHGQGENDFPVSCLEIRRMQENDLFSVCELERECFSAPWSRQGFMDALALPNTVFLVIMDREMLLGYAGMYVAADEGEITNVAVTKEARGKGIGSILMEEMRKEAQKMALSQIVLEVRASNAPAIHLYEKSEYVRIGTRRHFYQNPDEDAIVFCLSNLRLNH